MFFKIAGIDLRDNQRHTGLKTKIRTIVDDNGSLTNGLGGIDDRGPFFAFCPGEKSDINAFERMLCIGTSGFG